MYRSVFRLFVSLFAVLLLVVTGTVSVAQAASLCVHPAGAGQCYSSIQAAVDAASDGDQITIRGGKYVEQVTIIDKDLALIGRDGAVVQAPLGMEPTLLEFDSPGLAIIGVANADVTIRNLTVDGANSAEVNPFLEGITFINAGGVIRGNLIRNVGFGEPTLPIDPTTGEALYQGDPIVVLNFVAIPRTVTIEDNRIVNYNDIGIVVGSFVDFENPGVANLTAHILNNTVIGMGPNDVIDQWGISFFSDGFDDPQLYLRGTIKGNRISDLVTIDPFPLPGLAVFTVHTFDLQITNNMIENVNAGIEAPLMFNSQILENNISGPRPPAFGFAGLRLSGSDTQVRANRFHKMDIGIFLFVETPFAGSAFNTVLDDNRFENVPADVMTDFDSSTVAAASSAEIPSRWQRWLRQGSQ